MPDLIIQYLKVTPETVKSKLEYVVDFTIYKRLKLKESTEINCLFL
jgi:hypothetical protein